MQRCTDGFLHKYAGKFRLRHWSETSQLNSEIPINSRDHHVAPIVRLATPVTVGYAFAVHCHGIRTVRRVQIAIRWLVVSPSVPVQCAFVLRCTRAVATVPADARD